MMELADIKPSEVVPQEFDEPYKQVPVPEYCLVLPAVWLKPPFVWR